VLLRLINTSRRAVRSSNRRNWRRSTVRPSAS
jgi:ribosomal protein L39E